MNATKHQTSVRPWLVLAVVAAFLSALSVSAQVTSSTSSSSGQATVQTEVKRGEVIYVSGNDVVGIVGIDPHIVEIAMRAARDHAEAAAPVAAHHQPQIGQ